MPNPPTLRTETSSSVSASWEPGWCNPARWQAYVDIQITLQTTGFTTHLSFYGERKRVRATKNAISCCKSTPMSIPRTTNVPAIRPSTSIVCIHPLRYISSQTSCLVPFASKFHVCPAWSLPFSPYHYWSINLRTSPPPTSVCLSVCRSGLVPGPASGLRNDRALSNNLLLVTAILLWPDIGWISWRCKKNQTKQ